MKKSITRAMTIGLILACILGFIGYQKANETNSNTSKNSHSWAIAAYFYLDEKGYFYNGKLTYELPAGYEYVGDVINVGDTFSGKDFEGNVDGKIYMSQLVPNTVYFSWAEWDEDVDGPAPFLKLELKENN